jgi:hypothetical protein
MRRFCMSGVSRHKGTCATSAQVTRLRSPRGVGCDQQTVPFAIKWNRCHTAERFVIEISEAGIDLQIFQERENFDRCARQNSDLDLGMARAKRRRECFNHRQCGRDRSQPEFSSEAMLESVHFLPHRPGVPDDPSGPVEHALAFRSKALEADPRLTSSTPNASSSCLTPADRVGWVTPQCSAARPKCFSRARANRNSSFSSNIDPIPRLFERVANDAHRGKCGRQQ